ncbi:hypothetical protein Ahy_B09g098417 [Arachis hypogaea]|uniref:Uncharacterized protein n=1 Tax=Arachis hypogaea TaxID=3818 RepID=A0A444XRA0_ARAHY|nr:hypothetical protein Ahy_B09g098417 [Arachis hypogaea]
MNSSWDCIKELEKRWREEESSPCYNEPNPSPSPPLYEYQTKGYERYPIHNPQPPNPQAPPYTPPWNQNVYTPCYQPYKPHPYTPPQYLHSHDTPSNYTTFLPTFEPSFPPQYEVFQPLPQEEQDLQAFFQEQEGFRRTQGEFVATIAEALNRLASLRSSNQDIPLEECGGATKKCSKEEENMEPQRKEEGLEQELQQEEEGRACETEEVNGELREFDQEVDCIINDFLSTLVNPLNDLEEPSTLEFERDKEELKKDGEEEVITQEVEAIVQELNRITPPQGQIEWVTISSMSSIGPYQFALLETDYQLKVLLGVLNGQGLDVGCQRNSRHRWCKVRFGGVQHSSGYFKGAWRGYSSKDASEGQQEDDRETKVWDPGIHDYNQQFWIQINCLRLLESLMYFVWDPGGFLKNKHGWQLKDEWKHKPP